jgi:GrpB-like predicted nucleotidyltransferase (UPF0157 family)
MTKVHTDLEIQKANVGKVKELNDKIFLSEYDKQWPVEFLKQKEIISKSLAHLEIAVEHVGSTSVVGLMAKPILDILLTVPDSSHEDQYLENLEANGYWLKIREPEWFEHRMFKCRSYEVNLHVFTEGCSEVLKMIRFRDHLNTNKEDFELYQRTKRDLAQRTWRYTQNYADAKSQVVQDIMTRAL